MTAVATVNNDGAIRSAAGNQLTLIICQAAATR